jgi:predicted transcriptional regulator
MLAVTGPCPGNTMKTPCELVVGKILPTLRASVVKELSGKHHMKQSDIARELGITQASVSQYLSATRAGGTKITESFPKIKTYANEIANRIVAGENKMEWYGVLCKACQDIRSDDEFCKMHRIASNLSGCDICKKN